MTRKSVDVIREAAAEQRGFASQVVSPAKMRTKFLENAAALDRAADRLAELEAELKHYYDEGILVRSESRPQELGAVE